MMANWQLGYWINSKLYLPATGMRRIYVNVIFGREKYVVSLLWEKCLMLKHFLKIRLQQNIRGCIINDNQLSWLNEKITSNSPPTCKKKNPVFHDLTFFYLSTSAEILIAKRTALVCFSFWDSMKFPTYLFFPHQWIRRLVKVLRRLGYSTFELLTTWTLVTYIYLGTMNLVQEMLHLWEQRHYIHIYIYI